MKKKNNIFENKLQELGKLTIETKKEILEKEKREQEEKEKLKKLNQIRAVKFLNDYDEERLELKKFIKEVNEKFYKKYEMNIINPFPRNIDGLYCKETGGYASIFFSLLDYYEINIFVLNVLDDIKYKKPSSTEISLAFKNTNSPNWPSHFLVEVGRGTDSQSNPDYIHKEFTIKDNASKARKLAIEEFMNRLTDRIKLL
jgi:hypothetical protein